MPLTRNKPTWANLPPLARIHKKDNPKAWKEALGDTNGLESMDLETLKKQLPENRWKKLLEELYRDKKYFDYVKKSSSANEDELFSAADESLQFLYGRALFWEQKEPIPNRPPSHVKRMYSRYEQPKSSKSLQRSATTPSRSGKKVPPRTPSTQVSRMKKREKMDKKAKNEVNKETADLSNGVIPTSAVYFEGGTQTDFSPVPPLTPVMVTQEGGHDEQVSLPGSAILYEEDPGIPYSKEVTRSDIKIEYDYDDDQQYHADEGLEDIEDADFNDENNVDVQNQEHNDNNENITMAV